MNKQQMTQPPRSSSDARRRKPEDLDAGENQRWEEHCAELDRAVEEGDGPGMLRALAMLERLRYGCR